MAIRGQESTEKALQTAVYRLLLTTSIHTEIQFFAPRNLNGEWEPGAVEDWLMLKRVLPMPFVEEDVADMGAAIRMVLSTCQSAQVRNIPPGNIAHHILMSFRQSQQPYRPSLDEMMPLI